VRESTVSLDVNLLFRNITTMFQFSYPLHIRTSAFALRAFLLFNIFLFLTVSAQSQKKYPFPKYEVRAVWITTLSALDWPHSYDVAEQKRSLREMVDKLSAAHFNTIFFQVRGRGDALYRSSYEPWSQNMTGTLGEDPGWDPLQEVIALAHERGMEVHAWFNTFLVRTGGKPPHTEPQHLVLKHPEWMHDVDGEWWVDAGYPAAREYTLNVALEIVKKYDIDGFHFDFMRYPEKGFNDGAAYRVYGSGMARGDWRRKNIDTFVASFYDSVKAFKPRVRVGSAPIGIYHNENGISGLQSYDDLYQDSREWLRSGKHDYIVPQVYWPLAKGNSHTDFAKVLGDWSANAYGRDIYPGIGVFKPDVAAQTPALIDTTRALGFLGNSFFRYEFLEKMLSPSGGVAARYAFIAFPPPMPWKDSIPPNAPQHLHIQTLTEDRVRLEWISSSLASDGDTAAFYNVYRSSVQPVDIADIRNLVCSQKGTSYVDALDRPSSARFFYVVTAMDGGYNESIPTSEESIIVPEIVQLAKKYQPTFALEAAYPSQAKDYVYFPYELKDAVPVWLFILDKAGSEMVHVVDAYQQPGRYVAGAQIDKLPSGDYTAKLVAGKDALTRSFTVSR